MITAEEIGVPVVPWIAIDYDSGSQSRGEIHPGLVAGCPIRAEYFDGVYAVGAVGEMTYVVTSDEECLPQLYAGRPTKDGSDPIFIHLLQLAKIYDRAFVAELGVLPAEILAEIGECVARGKTVK